MTGAIRKYQKILWVFISAAVIISFVVYFSPNQASLGGGGENFGQMDGRPIKRDEIFTADRLARLSGLLRFGEGYDTARAKQAGFDLEQERYKNLLIESRAKELGIQVSNESAATWIRQNLRDPRTGTVDYDGFLDRVVKKAGFSEADFQEWVRLQVATDHLTDVVGVSGELVTPREATEAFQRENESLIASAVFFSSSNYLASVNLDPAALTQFYSNRIAVYRIPERHVLSYVRWETTNFLATAVADLAKITDLTNRMELAYQERGPDFFRDPLGQPLSKQAALDQLKSELEQQRSLELASLKARDFANELYQMTPTAPANLTMLAQKLGLNVATTEPFTDFTRPAGLEDIQTLSQEVAKLSAEQPFTTPMRGSRGVVVATLTRRLPGEIPPYEIVQQRVADDYQRFRSQEAARAAGDAFIVAVTNGLAAGKSFAAVAAEQNNRAIELSPFSISSPTIAGLDPRVNVNSVKGAAFSLKPGTASGFVPTAEGGFVLFLKERQPVDDAILKAGLNAFLEEQRRNRRGLAFQEWLNHEFQKSGLAAQQARDNAAQQ
jgi:hypothetical protein